MIFGAKEKTKKGMDRAQEFSLHHAALDTQRMLRLASSFFPLILILHITLFMIGKFNFFNFFINAVAFGGAFYFIKIQNKSFWWLKRGPIVSLSKFDHFEEARAWLKYHNIPHYEVVPGSYKFYSSRQAVYFKMVWC